MCEVEVNPKDWCRVATHMLPCTACVAARPPRASGVRLSSVPYGKVKVNLNVTSSGQAPGSRLVCALPFSVDGTVRAGPGAFPRERVVTECPV